MNKTYKNLVYLNLPKESKNTKTQLLINSKHIIENYLHLCKLCKFNLATCKSKDIYFGKGIGKDNVISCSTFKKPIK